MRLLQVGERVVVIQLDVRPSELVFCVQTDGDNPNGVPYRAAVWFQFQQKNYVQPGNLKAIQDSIAEVFSPDTASPTETAVPAPQLEQVAGLYVMPQAADNRFQLNADGTFSLVQLGRNYSGTFTMDGDKLMIQQGPGGPRQAGILRGDTLTDPKNFVWVKQNAAAALVVPTVAPLRLPATYVSAQTPAEQIQLNADNSFSLQEAGQSYQGTFVANGNTVELNISGGPKTTATIQGNNLTDSGGQMWVLREQSAGTAPAGALLKNEDIVKMAKAGFDDAVIVAKIGSSKCQFDTSTDALIQLKQSGVSAAVLKAIVSTIVVDPFPGTSAPAERSRLVATHATYFGVWNKVEAGGIVKVIISGSSEQPRVHLWGSCLPKDCDHGEADGHWDGSALTTTLRIGNQPVEYRLTLDRSANLQLNCHIVNGRDCVPMSYRK